jgi:hypothetical protein
MSAPSIAAAQVQHEAWAKNNARRLGTLEGKATVEFADDFAMTDEELLAIKPQQEYEALMQRAAALVAKAALAGGFINLSAEDLQEFGGIAAAADRYETEALKLFPSTENSARPFSLKPSKTSRAKTRVSHQTPALV